MAAADIAILAIIGLYVFFGFFHGFVVSMLRLTALILMFMVLTVYAEPLSRALPFVQALSFNDQMAFVIAVAIAFAAIMVATWLITLFVKAIPTSGASRLLGGILGIARASVFLTLAVIISSLIPRSYTHAHFQQSALLQIYGQVAKIALAVVPATGPGGGPTQLSLIQFDPETKQPSLPQWGTAPEGRENAIPGIRAEEDFIPADSQNLLDLESFISDSEEDPGDTAKIIERLRSGGEAETGASELLDDGGLDRLRELAQEPHDDPAEVQRELEGLMHRIPIDDLMTEAKKAFKLLLEAQQQQQQPQQ
ncbi:MAG: CvpA family protein [Betaproteobacteria bacterium AqS2]|uniref:CvpA family protein n=1 Tax=Candidatus Amphirhobacter heronislandensis TaxID=1732024 RepID=A0A930UFL3_9GAMM|nr:CvpA family protein [Betaproteobacteria bacterium AqS2]